MAQTQEGSVWAGLLCGAVAGLTSKCVVYPMDTVKALLQLQGANQQQQQQQQLYRGTWDACRKVSAAQGVAGFYRGFGAIMVGVVPANIAYYGGYELGKQVIKGDGGMLKDMGVGAIAQVLAGLVYTPIDIIKERMQVQRIMGSEYSFRGPMDALSSLWRVGGIRGVFKGYWATNAVWLPWNVLYISLYEQSKRYMAVQLAPLDPSTTLPIPALAVCTMGSAAAAAVATHPLDVVKTRLQVLSAVRPDITFMQVTREVLREEGVKGMARGLTARVLNIAPGCALSWMVYETLKEWTSHSSAAAID